MENSIFKRYRHNPPHLFIPGAKYFVTASTYNHRSFFKKDTIKIEMLSILNKGCKKYHWTIDDWVLLDDHYHIMFQADVKGEHTIAELINNFHKFSSLYIRKNLSPSKLPEHIFYNYWDTCITFERSYFTRINYIYMNPVKHGYVLHPEDYPFGSYYYRFKNKSENLTKILKEFPSDRLDLEK